MKYVARGTQNPTRGVYIQATNGYFYTEDKWDGSYTPNGIAVITSNCRFVLALRDSIAASCPWGGYARTINKITTTTDMSAAQADYDGESQTTTIINALEGISDGYVDGAPAAEHCRAYTFPDGSVGYLGAAGEWQAALDNKAAITSALAKCGGIAMNDHYWTSTLYSLVNSWCTTWTGEYLFASAKNNGEHIRAFCSI